jgi:ribose/xylose/arabinose/galactoside ABC-type transport system permease subunit
MQGKITARGLALLVALAPGPAWGHPGHGAPGAAQGWLHQLAEPVHALPLAALILAAAAALCGLRLARTRSRP